MSLTCAHYLSSEDFIDLEALFLGLPIPSLLRSLSSTNLTQHGALGDWQFTNAHYAGYTRRVSHDQLAVLLADFARRANFVGVQTQYSRIPVAHRSDRPDARGDIFFPSGLSPLAPNQPFVLDVRLSHLFTRTGNFRPSLLSTISNDKNRYYKEAYSTRNIKFAPLPVNTFLGVGQEVCHLLYRFALLMGTPTYASSTASSLGSQDDSESISVVHSVTFSRLLREFQYGVALATLMRLRGRDGFVSASSTS
mmetsp:Transcript_37188/g.98987  ORF Transcript_37188/g.98987 Transcript_37188/m.98987 type:complete len:251 (+) Transcript_37188:1061-1813(+)